MWSWLAVSLSGLLHISAATQGPKWQFYFFKPFTILLMLVLLIQSGGESAYVWLIGAGLIFSMIGDVFLMLPKDRFLLGLASFLGAHVLYSSAFWLQLSGDMVWWLPAILFAAGIIIFLLLLPNLGNMALPVIGYILVIVQMAWAAGEVWLTSRTGVSLLAFSGALMFMLSDVILAFDRFKHSTKLSTTMVMGCYYVAQGLITASAIAFQV